MSSPSIHQTAVEVGNDAEAQAGEAGLRPAVAAPPKQRRRPALIGLGVALVALGGLGAAWLATSVSDTVGVIALRNDVARGEVIEADDLTVADINTDPSLSPVSADSADAIVGQHAAVDMARGSLLTRESVTETLLPAEGQAMVGVAVTISQLPTEPLRPGDTVRIVDTPGNQDDPPTSTPKSIEATVVRSTVDADSGQRIVDVVLPADSAVALAARVATGRIAIVLSSRVEG